MKYSKATSIIAGAAVLITALGLYQPAFARAVLCVKPYDVGCRDWHAWGFQCPDPLARNWKNYVNHSWWCSGSTVSGEQCHDIKLPDECCATSNYIDCAHKGAAACPCPY